MEPREILKRFDRHLLAIGLRFGAVVLGGTALNLLGVVSRTTKDCDVLDPEISAEIAEAARRFARDVRSTGETLRDDWLNNGVASLVKELRPGWRDRLQPVFAGSAIELHTLGREDLLCSKLFALCDRGIDLADCVALAPTVVEIERVLPWLEARDGHSGWPAHARATLHDLLRRLGHVV